MRRFNRRSQGTSLVEALVALAVLAFGVLGVVALQGTLRADAEVARQRTHALRLAQETLEQWRAFVVLAPETGRADYAGIASANDTTATVEGIAFTLQRAVVAQDDPRLKTVSVDVRWTDRGGDVQTVRLRSAIAGVEPALGGALALPVGPLPTRMPLGRHPAIPIEAVEDRGVVRFTPPQADGGRVSWVFDRATALIKQVCDETTGGCVATNAMLLTGHVRFARPDGAPTAFDAEFPAHAPWWPLRVVVDRTAPSAARIGCHVQVQLAAVRYVCAVPAGGPEGEAPRWSGRVLVLADTGGAADTPLGVLASSVDDAGIDRHRVCRYTPVRHHGISPPLPAVDHPLEYVGVDAPLSNQNFLIVRAGDGLRAFGCPDDDPGTAHVDGRTWHHQPAS